jgi:hypothetical protein
MNAKRTRGSRPAAWSSTPGLLRLSELGALDLVDRAQRGV